MINHKERDHALLSASSAHRWLLCTPSARLEDQFPDTTSEAASEGTLAHELAEMKLRNYFFTPDFSKKKLTYGIKRLQKDPQWKEEMMGYTDQYLDYVKAIALSERSPCAVRIETQVSYGKWAQEGFGTADCILIRGAQAHIIDFKYGKGVEVSPVNNPQLMLYALGVLDMYQLLYRMEEFHLHIVQPRLDNLSEWVVSKSDLLAFGETVKEKAALAFAGEGDFCPGVEQCRFCRAGAQCRARADLNTNIAAPELLGALPPLITPEQAGYYLTMGEDVDKWLKKSKSWALSECLAGREVPGWKAVEGRGSREWTDQDAAFKALIEKEVTEETVLYQRVPLTVAQVESEIGKVALYENAGDFIHKTPGKPALVKESDKRKAITNTATAAQVFGS